MAITYIHKTSLFKYLITPSIVDVGKPQKSSFFSGPATKGEGGGIKSGLPRNVFWSMNKEKIQGKNVATNALVAEAVKNYFFVA